MIKEALDEIAALSGKNEKRDLLASYADNDLLKRVIYQANSPRVKFYIKQIPEYTRNNKSLGPDDSTQLYNALHLLKSLSDRTKTGHDAIEHLRDILASSEPHNAYVIERIIEKNLKIGMSTGINKAIPNLIEETPYMGAKSFSEKGAKKLFAKGETVFSQVKMDGTYRNAIIRNGEVELLSRQGETSYLEGAKFLESLSAFGDCVLNGELTIDGCDRYEANGMVTSIIDIRKKEEERTPEETTKHVANFEEKHGSFDEALKNMRYTVWDRIGIDEYFEGKSNTPYKNRFKLLGSIPFDSPSTMLSLVESRRITTYAEAIEHFLDTQERGLEGTIIKSSEGGWKDGKPTYQIKMKLELNIDLRITGFLNGNVGTKNEHVISRLQVESSCGILTTQPSGMKEAEMKMVTENQEDLMGTIVEVRCSGLSQDSKGNWSLLHPSVVEFRSDKDTCDSLESAQEIQEMAKALA